MEQTNTNTVAEVSATETPATFDELLKNPEYQKEFDKKVAKALEKSKAKWQKEADDQRTEAENLARMSEEEKHQHALAKANEEKDNAIKELNAYRLKEEASKIAKEKGMDLSLLDLIDYRTTTAENVKTSIDTIYDALAKAVENQVNERLKQPNPKQVVGTTIASNEQAYMNEKYKNNPYYRKK